MSNEIQKLKPVERSLYRRVFMARIEGGQSPEAAHRHGLNAVKMWNEVGAFNEESSDRSTPGFEQVDAERVYYANLLETLAHFLESRVPDSGNAADLIRRATSGSLTLREFTDELFVG